MWYWQVILKYIFQGNIEWLITIYLYSNRTVDWTQSVRFVFDAVIKFLSIPFVIFRTRGSLEEIYTHLILKFCMINSCSVNSLPSGLYIKYFRKEVEIRYLENPFNVPFHQRHYVSFMFTLLLNFSTYE